MWLFNFFFSSRRRHTRYWRDWSSDVCSSDLKAAIVKAKSDNMPNDNIDRAIKKGVGGGDGENYESITYEGYGAGGVAIIVETLTDNKNRTAGNVRYYFDKNNGNLGTPGCVDRK